jgi:hypothetical protein
LFSPDPSVEPRLLFAGWWLRCRKGELGCEGCFEEDESDLREVSDLCEEEREGVRREGRGVRVRMRETCRSRDACVTHE